VVFTEEVDSRIKGICLEISKRYEIRFIEIGVDENHVHFLVQSVPMYSGTKIMRVIKSITAREVFKRCPEVKKQLWGGEFWSKGSFMNTVGHRGSEESIKSIYRNREKKDNINSYIESRFVLIFSTQFRWGV
jgi:REP element-mobilizing transposase RayT